MDEHELIDRVLRREPQACREMITLLTPVIRRNVSRVLRRWQARTGQAVRRSDVLDLTQEVFVALLEDDAKVLRRWDPSRGMSLAGFVGLVAARETRGVLRSGRKSGWAEDPTESEKLEQSGGTHPEGIAASRQHLQLVLEGLRDRLSPRNYALFEALYVHERSVGEVAADFATTPNALYTFRSRLRSEIDKLRTELTPLGATL
ncbi:MAG: hypothetical protein AAGE52_19600 [Myxococcota bacterium]